MKKITLFLSSAILAGGVSAQSMSENFDSYSVGDYMGLVSSPEWTTWSGSVGGSEDVQVTATMSSSAPNAIYFQSSSSSGGPQDVVVPFGGEYNTGDFHFETDMYVVSAKGAYFNFQATNTAGEIWTLNVQMVQDGQMYVDDGVNLLLTTTYPTATWFTLTIDANLNVNDWDILINGVSQGVVQTDVNQIASIDIYPVNASYGGNDQAGYYIDNFEYLHTPYTLMTTNGAVTQIKDLNGLASQVIQPTVKIRNLGTSTITSFDLEVTYDGTTLTENISSVSIASLDYYEVPFTGTLTLSPGINDIVATISNVNGADPDDDISDDSKTVTLDPVVPAVGKVVVGEEGTGTWCGWCPRGAVFMDKMETNYEGFWAGIAVHNGDPMTDSLYDDSMGGYISGYPSGLVDRGADMDPTDFEAEFLNRIQVAPVAILTPGAIYNSTTGEINVSITSDFVSAATGTDYSVAFVMTEDDVTGTGSAWNQSNYYAGGSNGVMGGFELLPNPVPAASMVYDHVARFILPSWDGQSGVFPASVSSSDSYTATFMTTLDPTWEAANMHIIGLLIHEPTGAIDNACIATIAEAEANGYVAGVEDAVTVREFGMYPNPANEMTNISIGEVSNETVVMSVVDLNGKIVGERNYGVLNGSYNLPVNISQLSSGIYTVRLMIGGSLTTQKLVVE